MDPLRFNTLPAVPGTLKPLAATALTRREAKEALGAAREKKLHELPRLPERGEGLKALGADPAAERARVAQAASDFEAVFMGYLSSTMTKGALGDGDMPGAQFYQGMIDEQLGRLLAESGGGLGLQEALSAAMTPAEEDEHVSR